MHIPGRLSLFIVALAGCSTQMRLDPSAMGFVRLPREEAPRVEVRPSDLGIEWSRRTPITFASLAELGLVDAAWVKPEGPAVVAPPETVEVGRPALAPQCYFEEYYRNGRVPWPMVVCPPRGDGSGRARPLLATSRWM
jgi:hypothetical protein